MEDFEGAKLAILVGETIVTILRDDKPGIPWPVFWDLPGGGRESDETPEDCALRELREELGLSYRPSDLHWRISSSSGAGTIVWLFVCERSDFDAASVRFGAEGQKWRLAPIEWFLTADDVVPRHQPRLKTYLDQRVVML